MGLFGKKKDSGQLDVQPSQVPDFNTLLAAPPGPPPELYENPSAPAQAPVQQPAPDIIPAIPTSSQIESSFLPPIPPSLAGSMQLQQSRSFSQENVPPPAFPSQAQSSQHGFMVPPPPAPGLLPAAAYKATEVQQITPEEAAEFELPDFDEEELRHLEEEDAAKEAAPQQKEDVKPEEPQAKPASWTASPDDKSGPIIIGEEKKISELNESMSVENQDILPPFKPEMLSKQDMMEFQDQILAPDSPQRVHEITGEKYVELMDFLRLKEDLMMVRSVTRTAEEQIFSVTYKSRLDKYNALSNAINSIQDRLMLIDGKLFENKSEVNQ